MISLTLYYLNILYQPLIMDKRKAGIFKKHYEIEKC